MEIKNITYSQVCEDAIAWKINNNKKGGFFIDIGCNSYTELSNNTRLLIENDWVGVSVDYMDYSTTYQNEKNTTFFKLDATNLVELRMIYNSVFEYDTYKSIPNIVDFLSIDTDENSLKSLMCIDFEKYKYKCIVVEHDAYRFGGALRDPQREYLLKHGYYHLVEINDFEDWYLCPDLIDVNEYNYLKELSHMKRPFSDESIVKMIDLINK